MGTTKSRKSQDSLGMTTTAVSERCTQLLRSDKILQKIHSQFQFKSQNLHQSDEGWNSMAMGRERGESFLTAQEEFGNGTDFEDAGF